MLAGSLAHFINLGLSVAFSNANKLPDPCPWYSAATQSSVEPTMLNERFLLRFPLSSSAPPLPPTGTSSTFSSTAPSALSSTCSSCVVSRAFSPEMAWICRLATTATRRSSPAFSLSAPHRCRPQRRSPTSASRALQISPLDFRLRHKQDDYRHNIFICCPRYVPVTSAAPSSRARSPCCQGSEILGCGS